MTETEDEIEEKTEFKFDELSDSAKDRARDDARYNDVQDEWWDAVYEDAVRTGSILGIEISTTTRRTGSGKSYETTDIFFSGFSSQGDGACFSGYYAGRHDAVEKLAAETDDKELTRIANALFVIQLTRRLQGLDPVGATITQRGAFTATHTPWTWSWWLSGKMTTPKNGTTGSPPRSRSPRLCVTSPTGFTRIWRPNTTT